VPVPRYCVCPLCPSPVSVLACQAPVSKYVLRNYCEAAMKFVRYPAVQTKVIRSISPWIKGDIPVLRLSIIINSSISNQQPSSLPSATLSARSDTLGNAVLGIHCRNPFSVKLLIGVFSRRILSTFAARIRGSCLCEKCMPIPRLEIVLLHALAHFLVQSQVTDNLTLTKYRVDSYLGKLEF
jgi:hypothetical protein